MLREAVGENQYQNNLAGKGHSPYERTRPVVLIGFAIAIAIARDNFTEFRVAFL
jgi:hypothetical protein